MHKPYEKSFSSMKKLTQRIKLKDIYSTLKIKTTKTNL